MSMGIVIGDINSGKGGKMIVYSGRKGTSPRCKYFCHRGNVKEGGSGCDWQQHQDWGSLSSTFSSSSFSSGSRIFNHHKFRINQSRHVDAERAYGPILLVMIVLSEVGRVWGKKWVNSCPHLLFLWADTGVIHYLWPSAWCVPMSHPREVDCFFPVVEILRM